MSDWVEFDSNVWIYRASSLGGCIRSLTASRLGESASPFGQNIRTAMDESSIRENEALTEYVLRTGHSVIWQQKRCVLPVLGLPQEAEYPALVRGHVDGLDQAGDCILEVKWLSARNFDLYNRGGLDALGQLGVKYRWQGAVYGHANERKVRFVIGDKGATKEQLENEDGPEWLIIDPPVTAESLVPLQDIYDRVVTVEEFAERDELPDCDRKCSKSDPFAHTHIFPSAEIVASDTGLEELLKRHHSLSVQMSELSTEKDQLTQAIKNQFGPGEYVAGSYKAQITKVATGRCDTVVLKKRYPEIYEELWVPREDIRLTIKEI